MAKEDITFRTRLDISGITQDIKEVSKVLESKLVNVAEKMEGTFSEIGKELKGAIGDKLGISGGTLGIAAVGTALYTYANAVINANKEVQSFINTNGKMDEQAFLTAKNLQSQGYDMKETAIAANSLAKTFGVDLKQAYNIIEQSAFKGADAQGQMLDIFKEYPAQMRDAGYSLEEFAALTIKTQQAGLYNDKGIDAIKEANLSLREMGDAQIKALAPIEDSVEARIKEFAALGKTKDALKLIGSEMKKNYLTTQQQQLIIADIFKGAGEDAGRTLFTLVSDPENFDKLKDLRTELTKSGNNLSKEWNKLSTDATKDTGLVAGLQNGAAYLLNGVNGWVSVISTGIARLDNLSLGGLYNTDRYEQFQKRYGRMPTISELSEFKTNMATKGEPTTAYGTSNFITPNAFSNDPLVQNMQGYKGRPEYKIPGAGYTPTTTTTNNNKKPSGSLTDKPINNIRELSINITKMVEKIEINNVEDTKKIEQTIKDMFNRMMLDIKPSLKN